MMADLGRPLVPAVARSCNISARLRPAPNAPIFKKLRRLMPSQYACLPPRIVSMVSPRERAAAAFRGLLVRWVGRADQFEVVDVQLATGLTRLDRQAGDQIAGLRA